MDLEVGFSQRWSVEGGGRIQVWGLEKFERAKIKNDGVPLVAGAKGDLVDGGMGERVRQPIQMESR